MDTAQNAPQVDWNQRQVGTTELRQEALEDKKPYNITIEPQSYGYFVRVGCKTMAIETKEKLIEKLMAYLNDPVGTERKFNSGELFK